MRYNPCLPNRVASNLTAMPKLDDPYHDTEAGERFSTRDTTRIDDTRIDAVRPLITPALLMESLPVSEAAHQQGAAA